jgi:hypothetical protein
MTAPAGTTGWFQYDPQYNAPLTAAELDLFNRLQSGDPVLRAQYEQKYGPVTPSIGTDGWYAAWVKDQDYWNMRYLNQLAPPEEMDRLQQSIAGAPYPYSLFVANSLQQMKREGTLDAYLAGFADEGFRNYLAFTVGLPTSGTTTLTPTSSGSPTFTPTQQGEGPAPGGPAPTPYGPISPGPSTPTGGATTVPPVSSGGSGSPTVPQGIGTASPTTLVTGETTPGQALGAIPMWAWALLAVGAVLLFVRRSQ